MHGEPVRIQLNASFSCKEMITFYEDNIIKSIKSMFLSNRTLFIIALASTWDQNMYQEKKKFTMVIFLIFVQKNVSTIRFQEIKIRPFRDFEKKAFFSLFLMRKRLSSGQKWFLRPYFPLIRGMFLLRSGLRFSFRALEDLHF